MNTDNQIVQFKISDIELIKQKGGTLAINPKGEEVIKTYLDLKMRFEEAERALKDKLKEAMIASNCIKIEGDEVKVSKRFFGERFALTDPQLAEAKGFATTELKYKVQKALKVQKDENGQMQQLMQQNEQLQQQVQQLQQQLIYGTVSGI